MYPLLRVFMHAHHLSHRTYWPTRCGPTGPQGPAGQSAFEAAQQGGYTGTQSAFYTSLANISNAILSTTIRANEVVTMAQYQNLISLGQIDPHTAYDIIEEQV